MADSTTLTAQEIKLLFSYFKHAKVTEVAWEEVAKDLGQQNSKSARESFRLFKIRKLGVSVTTPATPASNGKKRKASEETGAGQTSEKKKRVRTPTKKQKMMEEDEQDDLEEEDELVKEEAVEAEF